MGGSCGVFCRGFFSGGFQSKLTDLMLKCRLAVLLILTCLLIENPDSSKSELLINPRSLILYPANISL